MAQDVVMDAMSISTKGMKVQADRGRIAAQNLANSSTTNKPGEKPYQREIPFVKLVKDRQLGIKVPQMTKTVKDTREGELHYEPGHPHQNEKGYVEYPNVNPLFETADGKEAGHAYQANLKILKMSKEMYLSTLELLK